MPWCDECDRFLSPASVRRDGTCPTCSRPVDRGKAKGAAAAPAATDEEPLEPVPWHFKLLLAAVALYLGYRAFQGIEWLVGQG
ncbi:MAG: hypothetical protein MUP97_03525 [Acidimicrobiia bacterium]|nr:hypothetical protein [Acidimicrobiia bacterium]